jgi:O-antigen biosynthesis protein
MRADLVLVSHNSKEDLERFLPSIKEHTSDYNLVIVDNGSNVPTLAYLKNCEAKVIYQENKGYGAGCNAGAKNGNSEFIVFLNCDLLASKNWLTELLKPFEDEKTAITGARLFDLQGKEYPTPESNMAIGCCFAIRRKVFEELGGFDENFFLFFEETDLCMRALKAGYWVKRSEAQLTHFHPHFPPFGPELQKHWDKSQMYFWKKHSERLYTHSLALVMIVKNEELGLERAILSCRDFVNEIVIAVDNSSTDKTEEIAKKYATTLKHFDWQDDFSAARNFAHEGVLTDWILFLDGHEYVTKCENLQEYLSSKHDGLMVTIEMETGMVFGNPRIYRRGVQFEGKTHERQMCQSTQTYPKFIIKHDRQGGQAPAAALERERQRNEQVPRIMGAEFRKNKKNTRATFHLALYSETNKEWKNALYWWKRYIKYAKDRGERWYAFFSMSECHLALGHQFRGFWYASKADNATPGRWETAKLKGICFFQKGKWEQAAECFVESLAGGRAIVSYKPWVRDISNTFNLIGECLYNLGIYDKASLAFSEAAKECTDADLKKVLEARAKIMIEVLKGNS